MTKQTIEIAINSRPDHNDRLWVSVRGLSDGRLYSGHIAQYLVNNRIATESAYDDSGTGVCVSFPASVGLTAIIRGCSEFFTSNPHRATFHHAAPDVFNQIGAEHADTGPALYFRIWKEESAALVSEVHAALAADAEVTS